MNLNGFTFKKKAKDSPTKPNLPIKYFMEKNSLVSLDCSSLTGTEVKFYSIDMKSKIRTQITESKSKNPEEQNIKIKDKILTIKALGLSICSFKRRYFLYDLSKSLAFKTKETLTTCSCVKTPKATILRSTYIRALWRVPILGQNSTYWPVRSVWPSN